MPTSLSKLEQSATELFAKAWYSSISIAEICRHAGLSNGIFYHYFKDKDELIIHLLEKTIERIAEALGNLEGRNTGERLESMVRILCNFAWENPDLVRVFREGQYRFITYERKLVDLYKKTLSLVLDRPVSLADYIYIFGGLRFASVRRALHGKEISIPAITACMEEGIFKGQTFDSAKVFSLRDIRQSIAVPSSSRDQLLAAGKSLFGSVNFSDVNIYKITEAAGLSVGSFYKYFQSKEAFFSELIEQSGKEIRRFITSQLSPNLNRLEREIQGIFLFGTFLSVDRTCYNIVREGEFILPGKVQEYYQSFEEGYHKLGHLGLDEARVGQDRLYTETVVEYLLGISHYYGIELVFDESIKNSRGILEMIAHYMAQGINGGTTHG